MTINGTVFFYLKNIFFDLKMFFNLKVKGHYKLKISGIFCTISNVFYFILHGGNL